RRRGTERVRPGGGAEPRIAGRAVSRRRLRVIVSTRLVSSGYLLGPADHVILELEHDDGSESTVAGTPYPNAVRLQPRVRSPCDKGRLHAGRMWPQESAVLPVAIRGDRRVALSPPLSRPTVDVSGQVRRRVVQAIRWCSRWYFSKAPPVRGSPGSRTARPPYRRCRIRICQPYRLRPGNAAAAVVR